MLTNPKLAFGEGWMNETITCEDGTIYEVLDLFGQNIAFLEKHPTPGLARKIGPLRPPCPQLQPGPAGPAQCRPSLRSLGRAL